MFRQARKIYAYTFEEKDRQAVKTFLKSRKLKLKDIHESLGITYCYLNKIVMGKRPCSSRILNKLKKMGVRFY